MAFKFKEVKEVTPWDKFAKSDICDDTSTHDDVVAVICQRYHEWLERQNPEVGRCILCERRFMTRSGGKS